MSAAAVKPWPVEIRLKQAEKTLEIDFDDGRRVRLPAELSQRLRDWKGLLGRHPAQARQIARNLVDGRLTLTNCRAKPVGSTR